MLDLGDLMVFSYVAELGSISAAARMLKMPKSSASRSLMRLEDRLGVVVVERSTRHLRLTDAGLLLQRHARRILDEVGEAENALGGLVGVPRGDLRINAPFTFAAGPLARMLPAFTARYPAVRVVLSVDNNTVDLQLEQMDVVIRVGPLIDSDLVARRLGVIELYACASPAYLASRDPIASPEDLLTHQLVSHADRSQPWAFRSAQGVREIMVPPGMVIPEPEVLKTLLIEGVGIGLLPDFHAASAIAAGQLVRVLDGWTGPAVEAHALYPSHRSLSAKVRVYNDVLVDDFAHAGT